MHNSKDLNSKIQFIHKCIFITSRHSHLGINNGYQKNEFDTSKFTLNYNAQRLNDFASKTKLDVFTGPSFGLDPDAPLFVNYPYGPGGLPLETGK